MSEHRMETIAKRLKKGEPWIALIYPEGVSQKDRDDATAYAQRDHICWYVYKGIAIAFFLPEKGLGEIIPRLEETIQF